MWCHGESISCSSSLPTPSQRLTLVHLVPVLHEEADAIVLHGAGVVHDGECALACEALLLLDVESGVPRLAACDLGDERLVCSLGHDDLFVEQDEDALWLLLDQVEHRLVVDKLDVLVHDALSLVHLFLLLERVLVEVPGCWGYEAGCETRWEESRGTREQGAGRR